MASVARVIFVDVDDTLVRSFGAKRIPMTPMIERVRELARAGANLYCWSSGGAAYAESAAVELGIRECFTGFLPKPNILIDDMALADWRLTQLHPNECLSMTAASMLEAPSR